MKMFQQSRDDDVILDIEGYQWGVIVFDDIWNSNQKTFDPFSTR